LRLFLFQGFRNIVAVDFDETCCIAGESRNGGRFPELRYVQQDVTDLQFAEVGHGDDKPHSRRPISDALAPCQGEFDIVLDKGTLDAVVCGGQAAIASYLLGVERVLRPGGCFVFIGGVDNSSQFPARVKSSGSSLSLVKVHEGIGDEKGKPVMGFVVQKPHHPLVIKGQFRPA